MGSALRRPRSSQQTSGDPLQTLVSPGRDTQHGMLQKPQLLPQALACGHGAAACPSPQCTSPVPILFPVPMHRLCGSRSGGLAGTGSTPRACAATLPGNKCRNTRGKLYVTIHSLCAAADNRGSVKTPCSLHTWASGVKIKLNGILPLVNTSQAYNSHT